jgi:hypothetical protein
MNHHLIAIIFWVAFSGWNFYLWKKSRDRDNLWLLGVGTVGFVAELVFYYLIASNVSGASSAADIFFFYFDPIAAIIFIVILVKILIKGGRGHQSS